MIRRMDTFGMQERLSVPSPQEDQGPVQVIERHIYTFAERAIDTLGEDEQEMHSVFPKLDLRPQAEIPNRLRKTAMRQQRLFDRLEPSLASDHPANVLINECFREVCVVMGIDANLLTVTVCEADDMLAYVNVAERRIAFSTGMLQSVNNNPHHIKAILGHELGHVVLKHYRDTDAPFPEQDDYLDVLFSQRARSYDEEYQADRLSTLALAFAGIPPQCMAEVLQILEKAEQEARNESLHIEDGGSLLPWATQSHPMTRRRIKALSTLVRNLPTIYQPATHEKSPSRKTRPHASEHAPENPPERIFEWRQDHPYSLLEEAEHFYKEVCISMDKVTHDLKDPFIDELAMQTDEISTSLIKGSLLLTFANYHFSESEYSRFVGALKQRDDTIDINEYVRTSLRTTRRRKDDEEEEFSTIIFNKQDIPTKILRTMQGAFEDCHFTEVQSYVIDERVEQIDLFPDEINAAFAGGEQSVQTLNQWKEETSLVFANNEQTLSPIIYARAWWGQAINRVFDPLTREEIARDIAAYSLETVRGLMQGYELEEYSSMEFAGGIVREGMLNKHMGAEGTMIIGSLLCKRWLECRVADCTEIEHIRTLLVDMDEYWNTHGYPFPLAYTRLTHILNTLYENGDETIREQVASLIDEYTDHFHLFTHIENCWQMMGQDLAESLKEKFIQRRRSGNTNAFSPKDILGASDTANVKIRLSEIDKSIRFYDDITMTVIITLQDCPQHIIKVLSSRRVRLTIPRGYDKDQLQSALEEASNALQLPENIDRDACTAKFREHGLEKAKTVQRDAVISAEGARAYITGNIIPHFRNNTALFDQLREMYNDEDATDAFRDIDLTHTAKRLSTKEFERQYLSEKGRRSYKKTRYCDLDRSMPYLAELKRIWDLGYEEEYLRLIGSDAMAGLSLLRETFPVGCALRDQIIARSIAKDGAHILETVDDIIVVQQQIDAIEDIALLIELQQNFHNIFLKLSVSKRIHQLHSLLGEEGFLAQVPGPVLDRQSTMLSQLTGIASSPQLRKILCILICYTSPSYSRDELLLPFLDAAHSWQEKQDISSFSSDPPFGVMRTKSPHSVMVHETLFAGFQKLQAIDKAEILLYLLKKKTFLSGIDNEFRLPSHRTMTDTLRWDHLLGRNVVEKDDGAMRNGLEVAHTRSGRKFYKVGNFPVPKVSQPDAVIRLQKHTGIPVDLIFKQHNVAVSHREQLEAMTEVLFGEGGVLMTEYRDDLLKQIARHMVHQGTFTGHEQHKAAIESLVTLLLLHCPDEKLPSMFLDMWHLAVEGGQQSLPQIVAKMMQKAGPVFVVAAQYLAHQTNSLSLEWTQAFRACVDENRVFDTTLIDTHISANLGTNPFADIHEKKGEGSKAIVNRVSLPDGRDCVVKIFHGFIARELPADIALLGKIVSHINEHPELFHTRLPSNLPEVVEQKMIRQIDPQSEIEGHARLRCVLQDSVSGVRFSTVDLLPQHTANALVTYTHLDGLPLDASAALEAMGLSEDERRAMRNATGLEVLRQLLQAGIYQSDPNLGNFLVGREDRIVYWVDYGSMETLASDDRRLLVDLLRMIITGSDALAANLVRLIANDTRGGDAESKVRAWLAMQASALSIGSIEEVLQDFQHLCARENYVLNGQWISVLGTLGLLRPLLHDCPPASYLHVLGSVLTNKS